MLKRIAWQAGALTLALCLLLYGAIGAGATYVRFNDVPSTYALAGEIEEAASRNLVGGYSDGTFRPDAPLTRGAFAKMLANAFVDKGYTLPIVTQKDSGIYTIYAAFIRERAQGLGNYDSMLKQILDSLNEPATRRDAIIVMAAVTERNVTVAGGNVGANQYVGFSDADAPLMAQIDRVNGAPGLRGVIAGFSDGTVRPDNVLKRSYGVAYVIRYANLRIESQREFEETIEITDANSKTTAQLRKELLGMTFNSPAFAETVAHYLFATRYFNSVSVTTTHGGEWDGQKLVRGEAGKILSVSILDGICESYQAVGRGLMGTTAPTRHENVSDLLKEIESFCGIQPPIDPTPLIKVKAYTDDDNVAYFWLSNVPSDTRRVEFAISNSTYTVVSDGEPCELGGTVNLFDSFATYDANLGCDYLIQWNADDNTAFIGQDGAIVASALMYDNDYPETVTVSTTVYTSDSTLRLKDIELKVPVYSGDEPEPEPLPGFVSVDAYVDGEDMVINVSGLRESAKLTVATFGGFGISLDYEEFQLEPSKGGEITVYASLENSIGPGTYGWVSLTSNATGNDLIDPLRVEITPFLGDYDFPMGVAA